MIGTLTLAIEYIILLTRWAQAFFQMAAYLVFRQRCTPEFIPVSKTFTVGTTTLVRMDQCRPQRLV
jgi:hypothetical protein